MCGSRNGKERRIVGLNNCSGWRRRQVEEFNITLKVFFFSIFCWDKTHITQNTSLWSVQCSGLSYIHNVVQYSSLSDLRIFLLPPKETPYLLAISPSSALSHTLETTNLLSFCIDFPILDISCKWTQAVYGLLCLTFFHLAQYFQGSVIS